MRQGADATAASESSPLTLQLYLALSQGAAGSTDDRSMHTDEGVTD